MSDSSDLSSSDSSPEDNGNDSRRVPVESKTKEDSNSTENKSKISIGLKKPMTLAKKPITGLQIKFNSQKPASSSQPTLKRPSSSVAAVFGDESDDEPEEIPPEAKMRMRNIGRNTPTSAGPNSFGKTKFGFVDTKKVFEKTLKEDIMKLDPDNKNKKKWKF